MKTIDFTKIKTGDIGIESNNNIMANAIKRVTKSKASHVYVFIWIYDKNGNKDLCISEYLEGNNHQIKFANARIQEGNLISIRRKNNLDYDYSHGTAVYNFGGEYDMKENILIYIKLRFSRILNFFGIKIKKLDNPFKHNCSGYASKVLQLSKGLYSPADLLNTEALEDVNI